MKILIIEDERYIAEPLEQVMKKNKYCIDLAFDGEDGLALGLTDVYDVIILDIMLPKINGIEVLQKLRKRGIKTPILMLTAKGKIEDKIIGLDNGADDYLPKPFDYNELLARVRALGRRSGEIHPSDNLTYGNIELMSKTLMLHCGNAEIQLPLKEFQLLELLIQRKETVVSKELIIEKMWGYDKYADYSHVEYHMSLLRKKLKLVNASVIIETRRGAGYILKVSVDES